MKYPRLSMLSVGVALVFATLSLLSPASAQEGSRSSIYIQNHTEWGLIEFWAIGVRSLEMQDQTATLNYLAPGFSTFFYINTWGEQGQSGDINRCQFDLGVRFENGPGMTRSAVNLCGDDRTGQVWTLE